MRPDRRAEWLHHEVQGSSAQEPLEQRILRIARAADELLDRFEPDALAIERVFASSNGPTVIGTAQASGVVIAAAAARGVPVAWHTPSEVKAAVTGDGGADKRAVTKMVARILRLEELPRPADAADAVAIAICHGWRSGVGAGIDAQAATTTTHQGARTRLQQAAAARGAQPTPAQRAWQAAEKSARRGR
nr:crossover junction endodeoxyribonuclease RuvC [Kocuria palustris]